MVQFKNVNFGYSGNKLFNEMTFSLSAGSIVGLLGRNGEGKTTLMKLLSGQLFPSEGSIRVLGQDPVKRDPDLMEKIFMVPEVVSVPNIKIRDYFRIVSAFYASYDKNLSDELLKTFGLKEDMYLHQISQGQQKKAVLALSLAIKAKLLLMDEPTNGLDIPSKSSFRDILSDYIQPDQTIIISTHQVRDLEQLIDNILMLESNKIIVNESIDVLGKCFDFMRVSDVGSDRTPLYTEGSAINKVGVYDAKGESVSDFSIELFFNAMIANPEQIKNIITQTKTKEA